MPTGSSAATTMQNTTNWSSLCFAEVMGLIARCRGLGLGLQVWSLRLKVAIVIIVTVLTIVATTITCISSLSFKAVLYKGFTGFGS